MLEYLQEKLGVPVSLTPWEAADHFALFLCCRRKYHLLQIGDETCVLVEMNEDDFDLSAFQV